MTNLGTHGKSILLIPDRSNLAAAQQFHDADLSDCISDVRVTPDAIGLGAAIAQTLETGDVRVLRQTPNTSPLNFLPAAFPITHSKKLVAAHALLLALDGVPGVHWQHLNATPQKTFESIAKLLRTRATHEAFASISLNQTLDLPAEILGVLRWADAPQLPLMMQRSKLVCLVNVSAQAQLVSLDWRTLLGTRHAIRDLVTGVRFNVHGPSLELQPYQVMWATV